MQAVVTFQRPLDEVNGFVLLWQPLPLPLHVPFCLLSCHSSLITVMLRLHLCLNFKSMLELARVARADAALLTVAVWLLQHGAVPAVVHGCSSVIQISLALILFYIIKQFHQINLK